jgi:hypothetical protein
LRTPSNTGQKTRRCAAVVRVRLVLVATLTGRTRIRATATARCPAASVTVKVKRSVARRRGARSVTAAFALCSGANTFGPPVWRQR